MSFSIAEFEKIGITPDTVARETKMNKDRKYRYNNGSDISIEQFFQILDASGYKVEYLKKGQKVIFVEKEITA